MENGQEGKDTKAAFLATLKEQAQRDGWARHTYDPEDRTYEARRYADGTVCRRVDELRPGDWVKYTRNSTGEEIEGKIVALKTFPEDVGQYAGHVWYALLLDKETANKVGHPVTIPHPRVSLVWPTSAHESNYSEPSALVETSAITAFVLLHEGKRLGWQIYRGIRWGWIPDSRYYFTPGSQHPPQSECVIERKTFGDWKEAEGWCAGFPRHPAEAGAKPGSRPAATVLGGNLRDKARENRSRVKVGDRVTVTAKDAPPERSGVVVEVSQQGGGVRVLHDFHEPNAGGLCWTWGEFSIDPVLGESVGVGSAPAPLAQTLDAISALCTQHLEDGGCPGSLADILREQADVLCSLS